MAANNGDEEVAEWVLRLKERLTEESSGNGEISDEEERLMKQMALQETDGMYNTKNGSREGDILRRLYCSTQSCPVKAKFVREDGFLCMYTKHIHQNHLETPEKGLKRPAFRAVSENPSLRQNDMLQILKHRQLHNRSKSDPENKVAIKNAKKTLKTQQQQQAIRRTGDPFANLGNLKTALEERTFTVERFLNAALEPTNDVALGALRNIVILRQDITNSDDALGCIIFTFPSAARTAKATRLLMQSSRIQIEIDYSEGFFEGNKRQVGTVGVSDANHTYGPLVVGVLESEDSQGSALCMSYAVEMLEQCGAVPDCCLKDGSTALAAGANKEQLIGNDCFAHITRLPFSRGGGMRGSQGSMARYLLSAKDPKTKKRLCAYRDVCNVLSYVFAFVYLPTIHDWITARALFMQENDDLPLHFYVQYLPPYPRWGAACHDSGEVQSGQGLEKDWDHSKKRKKHHQKVEKYVKDLEATFESYSQREEQHVGRKFDFATEPTVPKEAWDLVTKMSTMEAGPDIMSSACYSVVNGTAIRREDCIGAADDTGGYVLYVPNDHFANECKQKAIEQSFGSNGSAGLTIQTLRMRQQQENDRKCISTKPTAVKVAYIKEVGKALEVNTPTALEDDSCASFLRRRAQRTLSEREMVATNGNKKKKPKKGTKEYKAHQQMLQKKKWGEDVEKQLVAELAKELPKESKDDTEEQAEARAFVEEQQSKNSSVSANQKEQDGNQDDKKSRRNRLCGRACGQFTEIYVPKEGPVSCNCEKCQTNGWCEFRIVLSLVERRMAPSLHERDVAPVSMGIVRDNLTKILKTTIFNTEEEKELAKIMHNTYLPKMDPLFAYESKLYGVPVPLSRKDKTKELASGNSTMRLNLYEVECLNRDGVVIARKVKVKSLKEGSKAKVAEGDTIIAVNGTTFANDDGILLPGVTMQHVIDECGYYLEGKIPTMDVIRKYSVARTKRCGTFCNYTDGSASSSDNGSNNVESTTTAAASAAAAAMGN